MRFKHILLYAAALLLAGFTFDLLFLRYTTLRSCGNQFPCTVWNLFAYNHPPHATGQTRVPETTTRTRAFTVLNTSKELELQIADARLQTDSKLYGIRRYGSTHVIPDDETLDKYNADQLSLLYHSFLDNMDVVCNRKLRMGPLDDGGYEICDDYKWRPIAPCIVYSFGINYDFSFDDATGMLYGCQVFSFDPTMPKVAYNRSKYVTFYPYGISGKKGFSGQWHIGTKINQGLMTLAEVKSKLNHGEKVIDVLKIDVEGAEWMALKNMVEEGQLNTVRQLIVEYHQFSYEEKSTLLPTLRVLRSLSEAGFRVFYTHKNRFKARQKFRAMPISASCCHEVHYVNTNFTRAEKST